MDAQKQIMSELEVLYRVSACDSKSHVTTCDNKSHVTTCDNKSLRHTMNGLAV